MKTSGDSVDSAELSKYRCFIAMLPRAAITMMPKSNKNSTKEEFRDIPATTQQMISKPDFSCVYSNSLQLHGL